jgi:hypothetical protein
MQINSTPIAAVPAIASDAVTVPAPVATAKPKAPKAAKPAPAEAKPVSTYADERQAAAIAVAEFYSGASLPFKSASARLSDLNPANTKKPSARTAALIAAMLAYAGDNIKPDGTFTRGGFRVPARLINPAAKPGDTLAAMPESGCIGNILGRVCFHVSGPIGGKQARDGIFRLDFDAATTELQQIGDKLAKPALAIIKRLRAA